MAALRDSIQSLRCETADGRSYFVPEGSLDDILTPAVIKIALKECNAQLYREREAAALIEQGGRKTFAILITIYKGDRIISFIESDQLQRNAIDSRLPFASKAELEKFLTKADAADFFDKQWEFTSPVFSRRTGHRDLHDRTVFPFIESSVHGEGSFGEIHKVKLHHSQAIDLGVPKHPDLVVVRKTLKATKAHHPDDFERECRVLSFLNCLDHPNIVELLGSYTHNGIHSLIFPLADRDLQKLLQSATQSTFQSEADYLFAFSGLASAVQSLHSFHSDKLDIGLIGCHHDIRPHNVLVESGKLLLADFGLSNFKNIVEGSSTSWKRGDNRYLAPECEDAEKDFQPGRVGRKSDIWSLGCILAELVTYMMRGANGVKAFEKARKVVLAGRWTLYIFHAGHHPNKGLQDWLKVLDQEATPNGAGLIQLVNEMLKMKPQGRPDAGHVTMRLRILSLKSMFDEVRRAFSVLTANSSDLDLIVERERFYLWGYTMGLANTADWKAGDIGTLTATSTFLRNFENMKKIGIETALELGPRDDFHARIIRLRLINDDLICTLPHTLQITINHSLEQKLVNTNDLDLLQTIKGTFDEHSQYRSIGTLAAVRFMHQLCETPAVGQGTKMQLHNALWTLQQGFDHFAIGELRADGRPTTQALVEWIKYEGHWVDAVGRELHDRIEAVLELLETSSQSDKDMRTLSPIGYFHQSSKRLFGLAFNIPNQLEPGSDLTSEIMTLRQYMETTEKTRPSLDDRLLLARRLASALAELHRAKWVHKSISSFSIIFSISSPQRSPTNIPPPYIIGFDHSRPDDPQAFSNKPSLKVRDYCHPEYSSQTGRVRYSTRYDYYSLGLVLLEIGMWITLSNMTKGKEGYAPDQLLEYILQRHVPRLDFYVGRKYSKVVANCLRGEASSGLPEEGQSASDLTTPNVTQTIEEQLASCTL